MWDLCSPQPGLEPIPPALEVWGLNHWMANKVPLPAINAKRPKFNNRKILENYVSTS